jgi:hypothetical protein
MALACWFSASRGTPGF